MCSIYVNIEKRKKKHYLKYQRTGEHAGYSTKNKTLYYY